MASILTVSVVLLSAFHHPNSLKSTTYIIAAQQRRGRVQGYNQIMGLRELSKLNICCLVALMDSVPMTIILQATGEMVLDTQFFIRHIKSVDRHLKHGHLGLAV
jgi:hypothetical protein